MRRSAVAPLALLLPLAACGAMHATPDPDQDPDPGPPLLPCGRPLQFSLPGVAGVGSGSGPPATLSALSALATGGNYVLLAVDSTGDVHGYVYESNGFSLTLRTYDIALWSGATGPVTAVETVDGYLAAIEYGRPDPGGTALVPLDSRLGPRGPSRMEPAAYSLDSAIASAEGPLAFLSAQSNGAVTVKLVSPTGTDLGASPLVIDSTQAPTTATITAADTRFLVTWTATAASPSQVRAEILDAQMSVIAPPVTINPGATFDSTNPRAGCSMFADRCLFAWSSTAASSDELWVSLRDGQLNELRAIRLSTRGVLPRVAAGRDGFLVAWKDITTTSGIAAARVQFDGSVIPLVVSGTGGKALAWDLATRYDQPALIWFESGATPGGSIDPLCN